MILFIVSIVHAAPTRYSGSNPANASIHLPLDNETSDITENMFGVDAPTRNIETTDYVPQSIVNGVDLDGSNEDINSTFNPGNTDGFSFCWWINTTQGQAGQAFLGTDVDISSPKFFLHESIGRIRVEMHDSSGGQSVVRWLNAYSNISGGLNHSMCLTKRQGDCANDVWELYIDTVRREPLRDDNTCSANSSLSTIWIGSRESISWTDAAYDEMIVWNRLIDNATKDSFHAGNWSGGGGGGGGGAAPVISAMNCTSCNHPFGDMVTPYTTTDTTPTFTISTDINANCRVGDLQQNYSVMGSARNCATTGTTSHICSLRVDDELVTSTDYMYVSCARTDDEQSSSTSELQIELTGLDNTTSNAIDIGIQHSSVWPAATIYSDQPVFLRSVNNSQVTATVDRVVVYGNQRWIINYENETSLGLTFNISPTVYVLDLVSMSNDSIQSRISGVINATKS